MFVFVVFVVPYLPYVGNATEPSESVELNITNIQADVTYTVTYKPTNVNYTVIHYWQNVDNDNFTEHERKTLQGLTGSTVPEVANTYPGMYALLYEKPEIAADGSTVVEVYYDRNYYLMLFELDGGYGVEPIYARYGAAIGDVGTPNKAGYTFLGWSTTDDGTVDANVPVATMPAGNVTYYAVWKTNNATTVTIVYWGENANDEKYSYLSSEVATVEPNKSFTYTIGLTCPLEENHVHNENCNLVCAEEAHTHSESCYTLICDKEHSHSAACYSCGQTECTQHSTSCYEYVGEATSHVAAPDDAVDGQIYSWSIYVASGKSIYINGQWYKYSGSLSGNSIATPICHTHTDACIGCGKTEHTHTDYLGDCYKLTCGKTIHIHGETCYDCGYVEHTHDETCTVSGPGLSTSLWTQVKADTVTVNPDGSSVVNVYYDRTSFTLTFRRNNKTVKTFTKKWGADIHSEFPIKDGNNTIWWTVPNGTSSMKPGTQFGSLDTMPAENITFNYSDDTSAATLHYYVEALPGEDGKTASEIYNGFTNNNYSGIDNTKKFVSYKDINISTSGHLTYTEEFHNIVGFRQYVSYPKFDKHEQGGITNGIVKDNYLLYVRNAFDIVFYSPSVLIKTQEDVPYKMPLSSYYWEPAPSLAPDTYEPGSVQFEGWYLNPDCSGEKYDFTTNTMPAGPNNVNGETALALYAKWVPVNRTVSFYLDQAALEANKKLDSHPDVTVPHGSYVTPVPADPTNGSYDFVNWFYIEDGEEKAFDFANMPITQNMKVYGKWSSNVLKEYIVYFKIQGTNTEIADPITGSTMAGETKTFDAKGGEELKTGYQEGYFPLVESHSMTLDIDTPEQAGIDANGTEWVEITKADGTKKIVQSFTFEYVQKDAVPYTVYYVAETLKEGESTEGKATIQRDGKTYYIIADTEQHEDNRKAVVTEQFKTVQGYMPDAYQKRLVVIDDAENEIIFYYTVDTKHAYYKITHLTQNTDDENWTEYKSSQAPGEIGNTVLNADSFDEHIDGFTFKIELTKARVGNETTVVGGNNVTLTAAGLELKLYYIRNSYPYEVRYLEEGTGKELAPEKTQNEEGNPLTGLYGEVVSESAIGIPGYTAVNPTSQTLTIKIEESQTEAKLNIITFYYTENEVTINYEPVGPKDATNFGSVDPTSETLKVLNGTAQGSTATATEYYQFVGWYTDAECTTAVTESDGTIDSSKFTPAKSGDLWTEKTYYAKFVEKTATINYVAVGPEGLNENGQPAATVAGSVDPGNETLKVLSGFATGSTAKSNAGYSFEGWYSDAACTNEVGEDTKFSPQKMKDEAWVDGITYYAKFIENTAEYKYIAVFDDGTNKHVNDSTGGQVDLNDNTNTPTTTESETVLVKTGEALGATAQVKPNYIFMGWYSDAACTQSSTTDVKVIPAKNTTTNLYEDGIYYALFVEDEVTINYKGVAPDGTEFEGSNACGSVTPVSETIKVLTGDAMGSTATAATSTYKFVGWYSNPSCDEQYRVTETGWILNEGTTIKPQLVNGVHVGTTYYAKFDWNVGQLAITKNVDYPTGYSKESFPDDEFTFTVTLCDNTINGDYGAAKFVNGVATITLKAGETATISNLVHGTTYKVTEVAEKMPAGYFFKESTNADSAIVAGTLVTASFTNEYKVGSLTITKEVVGDTTNVVPGDEFEFTVQLSNKQDEYSFTGSKTGTVSRTDNTVKLKAGESITITGIPLGTDFTVTETANPNYTQLPDKVQGKIGTDSKAEFTNTYLRGDLQIKKTVTGNAPTGDEFIFTIELTGKELDGTAINDTYGDVTFTKGTATVTLEKDESITIKGLPGGIGYRVTEEDALGYTPTAQDASGQIAAGTTVTAAFTNVYKTGGLTVSKTVEGDTAPDAAFTFTLGLRYNGSDITPAIKLNGTEVDWKGSTSYAFSVPKNGSVNFSDIPDGATYTVAEVTSADFAYTTTVAVNGANATDATTATGTLNVATRETEKVAFTNTYTKGDLQITKKVENGTGFTPTVSEFVIQVELTGTNLNTAGYTVEDLATGKEVTWSGSATKLTAQIPVTATLGTPATVTIKHLPAGTTYTVTESAPVGFTASIATTADNTNTTNKIDAGKMDSVTVTNTYKVGSLEVTKEVDGGDAPVGEKFTFTLTLSDTATTVKCAIADGAATDLQSGNTFELEKGQKALITGIPAGVEYTVTETENPDYTTKVGETETNTATGTIVADSTSEIKFTNTYKYSHLTIKKTGMKSNTESAIFTVSNGEKTFTVVVPNEDSVTIGKLLIGDTYTVTESGSWTWLYTPSISPSSVKITEGGNTVTVTNSGTDKWLHDESGVINNLGTGSKTPIN